MKKLLSLMLCIVFVCLALVSCAEDVIGEYLPYYKTDEVTDDQIETLNFYIITGDGTSDYAKTTVPQNINSYLKEKYMIALNVVYCTESEYNATVTGALANTDETKRPDIVLVNSKALFETLYAEDSFVALNSFYNHRDFKSLNTIVDDVLLSASAVIDETTGTSTYYTVPNNHVIGQYKYIVIDKAMARDTLHFSNAEIEAMTTDESLNELKEAIATYYGSEDESYFNQHVQIVTGNYDDKILLEYAVNSQEDISESSVRKNIVNVSSYPTATKDEAFSSAFAIVKHLDDAENNSEEHQAKLTKHYTKCMSIIYALNTDLQLKNMLQYGYANTNYKFIKNEKNENTDYITLIKGENVTYEMNPVHTGNLFISYYCEEIGWNDQVHNNILRQNADAKTETQKAFTEIESVMKLMGDEIGYNVDAASVINLPTHGTTYSDVTFVWSSNSEYAVVGADGSITFGTPTENTEITLKVTINCGEATGEGTFLLMVVAPVTE